MSLLYFLAGLDYVLLGYKHSTATSEEKDIWA